MLKPCLRLYHRIVATTTAVGSRSDFAVFHLYRLDVAQAPALVFDFVAHGGEFGGYFSCNRREVIVVNHVFWQQLVVKTLCVYRLLQGQIVIVQIVDHLEDGGEDA